MEFEFKITRIAKSKVHEFQARKQGPSPSEIINLTFVSTKKLSSPKKALDKARKEKSSDSPTVRISCWTSQDHLKSTVQKLVDSKVITAKCGEAYFYRDAHGPDQHLVTLGIGENADTESLRRAGANIKKILKANNVTQMRVNFDAPGTTESYCQSFVEGILLGAYEFKELKSEKKTSDKFTVEILLGSKSNINSFNAALTAAQIISECINFSRRLGDLPGNLMTPEILSEEVLKITKGTGIKVQVWDKVKIKKEKMGCLLGVSMGSVAEPRFIIMEYNGGAKGKPPICFVGKGLTFDSGGISIKPAANMEEMKYDMCGGANTIGTVLAIAKLKLKVNVVGLVPASENMPGPLANKPGDVLTARNGKTVEVNNTDAEGRLILADALSYANDLKPSFIVDSATLTGAMVIALGDLHTGYFSKHKKLAKALETAAENSKEKIWQLPLVEEHKEDMKGVYADLNNISVNKGAGSAHGAAFLENFVNPAIPWAHVDIAGTAYHTGHRVPFNPRKGASGVMIRTYIELAKIWKP